MTKSTSFAVLLGSLLLSGILGLEPGAADVKGGEEGQLPNPFFAYCVGIGTDREAAALEAQLQLPPMLRELGYAGMACVGLEHALPMLAALEREGQQLFAAYTPLVVDPNEAGYDPALRELLPKLKGHGTTIWLVVNSKKYQPSSTDGDERAVELLREIADLARPFDVSISLYPHRNCYAERMEDVVRLARKADRPNISVTFTFCHFLAVDDIQNLDRTLQLARPYLKMAVINGTSGYDPQDRSGWIQVLGEGTFDVSTVLRALRRHDFHGPIGFIAYGIREDPRQILDRSMQAWKSLSAQATVDQ